MAIAFLAFCVVGVGFWQAVAVIANWPGLSFAGTRRALGGFLSAILLAGGAALIIIADDGPVTWVFLLPGAFIGFFFAAVVGAVVGARANPLDALVTPKPSEPRQIETVSIPVSLPHHHPSLADTVIAPTSLVMQRDGVPPVAPASPEPSMPGTLFLPTGTCDRALLLLCGAGDNRLAFKWPLVRELNARGIAVFSIDPPGHGDFMTVPTTVENTQCAAMAALDWLDRRFPTGRLGAIGISFGGNQAVWLAAHDARVVALALVSTPASLRPVRRRTVLREGAAMLLPANLRVFRWGSAGDFYRGWRSMKGYAAGPETLYAMIERFGTVRDMSALGERPVLLVHGRADVAVPFGNARALFAAARHAEILPVTHGTHLTVILRPEIVTKIADWLEKSLEREMRAQP
ncbi:MAG: alpha/beta fold hydrolase [Thermoflexales bacterium]